MAQSLQQTGRTIGRALLTFAAILFLVIVLLQAAVVIGLDMLSSGRGTAYLEDKINSGLTDSGYHLSLGRIAHNPAQGFTIDDVSLSDESGILAHLDRFTLAVHWPQLAWRTLSLSAQGGTLTVFKIPDSRAPSNEIAQHSEGLQPFTVPELYINDLTINQLAFDRVILREDVAGRPLTLSPALNAELNLKDRVGLSLNLKPGMGEIITGVTAPDTIIIDGWLKPDTLEASLTTLRIKSPDYSFSADGHGTLSAGGKIILNADAQYNDLTALTHSYFEQASLSLSLNGLVSAPAMDIDATLIPGTLKQRGLDDISLSLTMKDVANALAGDLAVNTRYQGEPIELNATLGYDAPIITVSDLKGTAPSITLSGGGDVSLDTFLADAALSFKADDLSAYKDLLGMTLGGTLLATAQFVPNNGQQAADINTTITNGAYDKMTVKKLEAQAHLDSLSTPWPQSAQLSARALHLTSSLDFTALDATITQNDAQSYALTFTGRGTAYRPLTLRGSAALSQMSEPLPTIREIDATARFGQSTLALSGNLTSKDADLTLHTDNFRAQDIPFNMPQGMKPARINATLGVKGPPSAPRTTFESTLSELGAGNYRDVRLTLRGGHMDGILSAQLSGNGTGIRALSGEATLPMDFSLMPFSFTFEQSAPLSGTVRANIDLAAISPLFLPPTQSLSGDLAVNATLSGTVNQPQPEGTVYLRNSLFQDEKNGILLSDLAAEAQIARDHLILTSLSAHDGGEGRLSGEGTIPFDGLGGANIALSARQFHIPRSDLANGHINADLTLQSAAEGVQLAGEITILALNILIPETFQSKIPQLNIVEREDGTGPGLLEKLSLAIDIDAPNQVFVRGWGLDAEFGGDINIDGTAAKPLLNGKLSARRGRYEEFGKNFALERAELRFQGSVPPSPYLDIKATTNASDVTAAILLTGSVQAPAIGFSATPSLPEDEVLSRILFGKDSTNISPFQAVQLAQTIQRFSGKGGGANPLGLLRSATGLDDISIDMDESGGANVGVGKYLSEDVYLEFEKGRSENSGAAKVQIEITPDINVESRIGQDAQTGAGIMWKHDY